MKLTALASGLLLLSACGPQPGRLGEPFPVGSIWASPPRPALDPQADTNDASAYYNYGVSKIWSHADTAAAAFYWATHLDPWRAEAYYARAVALVRTLWDRSYGPWSPTRRLRENEFAVVDSLNRLAYHLNPYIDRRFDYLVGPPAHPIICERVRDPVGAGVCFLQAGNFSVSLQKLAAGLKKDPEQIQLHYIRAHAYYQLGHFDSAAAELGVLADSLGQRQEKELTAFYVSRATIYYAQGMAYNQLNDTAAARVAYERALVEDLSFHMANVRLAGRALASGDTTVALGHLEQAVALSPSDVPLRFYYGVALTNANKPREAEEQFRRAIELNRHYAPPHLHLAMLLERRDPGAAARSYDSYLARAARRDSTRSWAARRLKTLVDAFQDTDAESLDVTPKKPQGQPPPRPDEPKVPPEPTDEVEQASEESFPASDPPAWEPLHPGKPAKHPDRKTR